MKQNQHIIVACSGGIDSIVLAHILLKNGFSIRLAHCNFQLREAESDGDETFVKEFAAAQCIPIQTIRFNTKEYAKQNKVNIQIAARELRYQWFKSLAEEHNAVIALGHHENDQIETFLIQLLRGGGIRGLCAMEMRNGIYIRPLLNKTKKWIENYANLHQLSWREDSSNLSNTYQRNEFRNILLHNYKEIGIQGLVLVNQFKTLQYCVERTAQLITDKWIKDKLLERWNTFPILIKKEIAYQLGIPRNQTQEIDKLTYNQVGSSLIFSSYSLFKERKGISIIRNKIENKVLKSTVLKEAPKVYNPTVFYVDANKIVGELKIRMRKEGDSFQPFGMKGKKLISKYLSDKKVLACDKKAAYVITDDKNIIAVEHGGINEMLKIDKKTLSILALQIIK